MRADRDDDDDRRASSPRKAKRPAPSRQHQKAAGRARMRRHRRAVDAGPGPALCVVLNLVHGAHPVAPPASALVAGLRALPDGWCPNLDLLRVEMVPSLLTPVWTALTTLARAVDGLPEIDFDVEDPAAVRARLVYGLLHTHMVDLAREAQVCRREEVEEEFYYAVASHLLQTFLALPLAWQQQLRRCAFPPCAAPYFRDQSTDGRQRFCGKAHQKAASRLRPAQPAVGRRRAPARRRKRGARAPRPAETRRPAARVRAVGR